MVLIEAYRKISANRLARLLAIRWPKAIGDKLEVFFKMSFLPCKANEFRYPIGAVIRNAPISGQQRNDSVVVSWKRRILGMVETLVAGDGIHQPWLVQTESTHRAANCIRQKPTDIFLSVWSVEGNVLVG